MDFAPFLSRTLLGSHGQELLIEGTAACSELPAGQSLRLTFLHRSCKSAVVKFKLISLHSAWAVLLSLVTGLSKRQNASFFKLFKTPISPIHHVTLVIHLMMFFNMSGIMVFYGANVFQSIETSGKNNNNYKTLLVYISLQSLEHILIKEILLL